MTHSWSRTWDANLLHNPWPAPFLMSILTGQGKACASFVLGVYSALMSRLCVFPMLDKIANIMDGTHSVPWLSATICVVR